MTHDSKELQPCPCCIWSAPVFEFDEACFVGQTYPNETGNTGFKFRCDGCGLQTCWWHSEQQARDAWNKRPAPQPGMRAEGEAAESVGDGTRLVGGIVAFEVVGDDLSSMAGFTRDEGVADIWRQGGLTVRPLYAAPPKPAPDAMKASPSLHVTLTGDTYTRPSSTPVPPPDGAAKRAAPERCPHCFDETDCSNIDVCNAAADQSTTPPSDDVRSALAGCILCANGNDLPDGEYCRACGRQGLATGLRAAVIKARGRQEPPATPIAFAALRSAPVFAPATIEALAKDFEGAEHVNWTGQEVADYLRHKALPATVFPDLGPDWTPPNPAIESMFATTAPASDPLAGLDERLDRLLLTATDGGNFVLSTDSAKNIVGIVREWIRMKPAPAVVVTREAMRKAAIAGVSEHGIQCNICGETLHDDENCDDAECPIRPPPVPDATVSEPVARRTFDTTGTVLTRSCNVLTITCENGETANRVAGQLRAAAPVSARDAVIEEIATERRRQIEVEGYDAAHDDEHTKGEIARAAACYAHIAGAENDWLRNELLKEWWGPRHSALRAIWPWDWSYFKPRTRRCDLIRSCAMNIAEIERIDRSLTGAKP